MFNIPSFEVEFTPSTRILRGLDEIGAYLRVHRRTAWRWIHHYGFPAMQTPAGTWFTSTSMVDLWIIECSKIQRRARTGQTPSLGQPLADIGTFPEEDGR